MPLVRAEGSERNILRLAKRARYAPTAWFTYRRDGCAPLELRFAGAALDLFYLGDYEPESLSPMATLAKSAHTFLDIGAQAGVYSMVVASANPSVEVFAFEADPTSLSVLLDNSRRNAGRPGIGSVRVCSTAVDAASGLAAFHLAGGNSSLNETFRSNTQELLCPAISIDDFLAAAHHEAPIDLVKIDTESTEPAVLLGMARTIDRWRPVITLEVLRGRTEAELDRFVAEADYRALWLRRDGPRLVGSVAGDQTYSDLNYLLVPGEKVDDVFTQLGVAAE
jgi:FkbM family methyltransferase